MKTINTHSQIVVIDGQKKHLVHYLTEQKGIFGLGVRLDAEYAEDNEMTASYSLALHIFDLMCKEQVLPLNFYSVIDDLYTEDIDETARALEG
ncbi:MAG: hypothetical protein IJR59_02520 [Firmicutes bacterium]|nr:hypothetical protein [Bacillota bacterium]